MSEIPELPANAPRSRPVPPGGLEAAVAGGRRRRNRFLGVTGGMTTALALVLVAALGAPAEHNDSLRYAEPEATASASATASPVAQTSPSPEPAAEPMSSADPSPEPRQSGTAAPEEPLDGSAHQDDPRHDARESYTEDPKDVAAPAVCQGAPDTTLTTTASGCVNGGPATSRASQGGQVTGTFGFCVSYNTDPVVLSYDDGREHEVRVHAGSKEGPVVWTFSDTVTYPQGAHERTVPAGRCLEWTGVWDTTLADGSDAPAGEYWVSITAVPDRVDGVSTGEHEGGGMSFTVTLTED